MASESTTRVVRTESAAAVFVWGAGWLFTIGFVKLSFWPGVLALFIWPYYLGQHFAR